MNEVIENILTRRSIRSYKSEQISDEELNTVLEAARYAPSGSNSQSWVFTVLQNQAKIDEMNDIIREVFKEIKVDENTYRSIKSGKKAAENDNYHFCYHAPTLVIVSNDRSYSNGMADSAAALENIFLASHSLGFGSCWINQPRWFGEEPKLREYLKQLGVPDNHMVCGAAAIGYNSGNEPNALPRKEGSINIIR
jgi:nitroreductase